MISIGKKKDIIEPVQEGREELQLLCLVKKLVLLKCSPIVKKRRLLIAQIPFSGSILMVSTTPRMVIGLEMIAARSQAIRLFWTILEQN